MFTKRNPTSSTAGFNASKRAKNVSKKSHKENFNRKMMMTQSSPFINRNALKQSSPDRSDIGFNTRVAQSRVSRYNLNKSEIETYNAFVDLISMFDQQSMADW